MMRQIIGMFACLSPLPALAESAPPAVVNPPLVTVTTTRVESEKPIVLTDDANIKVIAGKGGSYANDRVYASQDGRFAVDVSKYDKVTLQLTDWPADEFMYILRGRLQITDANGVSRTYRAGDSFIMPKGFNGTWRELSPIKKLTVIYQPPEPAP